MSPTIRHEVPDDHETVRHVHRLAFGQDDEAEIVEALRAGGHSRVSLVAEVGGRVVGHVLFSDLPILTADGTIAALSLAPMAVLPEFQRRGVGSALVREGLEVCRKAGHRVVVVLGHPAFYPRFGFSAKLAERLSNPFHGGEAWMAAELVPGALGGVTGWVRYPPPFGAGVPVRPVYRPDRDEWVRMRTALWPDGGEGEHAADVDAFFATGTFRSSEALLPWKVFVAERPAGGLCGFVEASIRPLAEDCTTRPVGYIEGWFVEPDVRRQGVGRKLVKAAEEWAATQGCKEMASDADIGNAVSHESHRAVGFEESGRLVHFRKRLDGPPEEAAVSSAPHQLTLLELAGRFAVCKLPSGSAVPEWATAGDVFSVTRTGDELSVVCRQEIVPVGTQAEAGWLCLRVAGSMPFTLTGVLASLTTPIAKAGVGVFAFSTFDTDYLLVKAERFAEVAAALRAAGHTVGVGDRVRLRPVQPGDLPQMYNQQLDPESNRMAFTIPRTKEVFDAHWAKVLDDPNISARAILVGEEMVGIVSCFIRDGHDHVGYWIDRAYWGRGIATRALELLLREVGKRPLVATAATSNRASLRVLQKCGFTVEEIRLSPATDRYPACEEAVLVLRSARTETPHPATS